MRVLVCGGAGFIGSHLTDRLLAEGHAVDVVDNLSTMLLRRDRQAANSVFTTWISSTHRLEIS